VVDAGAAIALQGRAEQAQSPHLAQDRAVEVFVAMRLQHARHQPPLAVVARRIAQRALLGAQLLVEQQRVIPLKGRPRHLHPRP